MKKLNEVALAYIKYCSAIETARDEFGEQIKMLLELPTRTTIRTGFWEGRKYIYFQKDSRYISFCTIDGTVEMWIGFPVEPKKNYEKRIKIVKSMIKNLEKTCEEGKWVYFGKECSIKNFKGELEVFAEAFKALK
jgi:hypothetical protein